MAQRAPARNAWHVKTTTGPTIPTTLVAADPHPQRHATDPRGRYAVYSGQGQLGVLKAVLSAPRLLLLDAPQVPDGVLLIPFEAIEQIKVDERTILVRSAREALQHTGGRSAGRRDGG